MDLYSYGRKLYQFYGKIYLHTMLGSKNNQLFETNGKITIKNNKDSYLELKNDFGNISQELSKDYDYILSALSKLFENLDILFVDITYENTKLFLENKDSITALESWDLYAERFKN